MHMSIQVTKPNIAMKFAEYVAWILHWEHCKFGENIYYNSRDIEFFLADYFFGAPCILFQVPCLVKCVEKYTYYYD